MSRSQIDRTDTFLNVDFWREFAPNFSIGGKIDNYAFHLTEEQKEKNNQKILREGYVHLAQPGFKIPFEELAALITKIVSLGLPPVFFFVYDVGWMLNRQMRNMLSGLLHEEYAMLPDLWAWCVKPGQAGWKPHRDKREDCLFSDGRPKSLTVWIPITQAHPLNGCMYILPADRDENYGVKNSPEHGAVPLADVRALPAAAGDVLAWTQHLYHWGGHSADLHDLPPRMSVAFEYQRRDVPPFNKPLYAPEIEVNFEQRLALISKQIFQYHHMYQFQIGLSTLALEMVQKFQLP